MCFTLHCHNKALQGNYCPKCKMRRWRAKNPVNAAYWNLKSRADKHHIPFKISLSWFKKWCSGNDYIEKKGNNPDSLSVDRIRVIDEDGNIMGYQEGNLQLLTLEENGKKSIQDKKDLWRYRKLENTDDVPF